MAQLPAVPAGQMSGAQGSLNAYAPDGSLNTAIQLVNDAILRNQNGSIDANAGSKHKRLAPEFFYTMQLLETIRLDKDQFIYFRYADEMPIENKAKKLTVRRWTPIHAHTVPLVEGVPPVSDRASAESYEILTAQYGRFMEFSDMVNVHLVDPIVANYVKEYSIVAIETLDMLARNALSLVAQPYFAGFNATSIGDLTLGEAKPDMDELRRIILDMKRLLVKPRADGHFHVIAGPEVYFDLIEDPRVEKYMRYNRDTYTMYSNSAIVPMFGMAFYETLAAPTGEVFYDESGVKNVRITASVVTKAANVDNSVKEETKFVYTNFPLTGGTITKVSGYVQDTRTGANTSYIPNQIGTATFTTTAGESNNPDTITATIGETSVAKPIKSLVWKDSTGEVIKNVEAIGDALNNIKANSVKDLKVATVYILGKDALIRTGIKGQGDAEVIVKALGSSGVGDPLNQRQSIGFKINSVGYGNARAEAVSAYYCIPSTLNL